MHKVNFNLGDNVSLKNEFEKYNLTDETVETLSLLGYVTATPIQKGVIPGMSAGHNVVGKSHTGSGKTAAFGIPICDSVKWEENHPQALVLEPTRELALQVRDELFLIGRRRRLKVPAVFGGMAIDKELITLKQKSHIVVGTPGRVMDHIRRGSLELSKIKYLVIDEADLMLDMGFIDEVENIINSVNEMSGKPIMALFSATMGDIIERLVNNYMSDADKIYIENETETVTEVVQIAYRVENTDKADFLMKILQSESPGDCMIFCDTREMVNGLYHILRRKKIRCGMLHGAMEQRERLYSLGDFRQGKFHIFITTDVAARGIDFPDITHVINYDFPTKKENYVHRIGRTARNGKSGTAISFIQDSEMPAFKRVEEYCNTRIEIKPTDEVLVSADNRNSFLRRQKEKVILKDQKGGAVMNSIARLRVGGGKKSKMRPGDIVGTICNIEGLDAEDIGSIDVRDSFTNIEILNNKGNKVYEALQNKPIKGKLRKVSVIGH